MRSQFYLYIFFRMSIGNVNVLMNGSAVTVGKRPQRKNHFSKSKMEAIPKTHDGNFFIEFFSIKIRKKTFFYRI